MRRSVVEYMVFSARKKKRLTEGSEVWQVGGSWKTSLKRLHLNKVSLADIW